MASKDLGLNRREAEREWQDEARVNCFIRFWFKYCTGRFVWLSRQELKRKTEEMLGHKISDQAFRIGLYLADLEADDHIKLPLWQDTVNSWWAEDLARLEKEITQQK